MTAEITLEQRGLRRHPAHAGQVRWLTPDTVRVGLRAADAGLILISGLVAARLVLPAGQPVLWGGK